MVDETGSGGEQEGGAPAPVELNLADDHVKAFAKARKPILAIEELIWNALDADAEHVSVDLAYNKLDGLESITVTDDGHGMDPSTRDQSFGMLGGSPKRTLSRTPGGRTMHGKEGKGRFRAFALGPLVEWVSRYHDGDAVKQWSIRGDFGNLKRFPLTSPQAVAGAKTGTAVRISNVTASHGALTSDVARSDLLLDLAPYLRSYPKVKVTLDDKVLDPEAVIENEDVYELTTEARGVPITAKLTVIEWSFSVERRLLFCTPDGFARHEELVSIQAKGFDFTAYVMSDAIAQMTEAELSVGDLDPRIGAIGEAARVKLREHFKNREAEKLSALVELWKAEGTYPYDEAEATTAIADVERGVFDILAVSVHQRLPGFEVGTSEGRRFTFKLLRQALETNPSSLKVILTEVLKLPKAEQDEFAELLQTTKLGGIVKAAKIVADRAKFVAGLKDLLFDPATKARLKERSQLQRILVRELWIFGEKYMLGLDDQSLKALLAAHMNILGRPQIAEEVKDISGADAIPDLMLYRRYADREQGYFEHLVVELKRPSVKAGSEEISQIENYAFTVLDDPRFDKVKTRWTFVLVVNDLDALGEQKCQPQQGRQFGHLHERANLNIFVKKWSSVIQECEWRHEFYRSALDLELKESDGRAYVEKTHERFLPKVDQDGAKRKTRRGQSGKSA